MSEYIFSTFDGPGINIDIPFVIERNKPPCLQSRIGFPQCRQLRYIRKEFFIFPAPGIRPPVVRIFSANLSCFITIIDTWRARHSHLPRRQDFHACLGNRISPDSSLFRIAYRQNPFNVMTTDEVQHGIPMFRGIIFYKLRNSFTSVVAVTTT